jgi:hypothetical protein
MWNIYYFSRDFSTVADTYKVIGIFGGINKEYTKWILECIFETLLFLIKNKWYAIMIMLNKWNPIRFSSFVTPINWSLFIALIYICLYFMFNNHFSSGKIHYIERKEAIKSQIKFLWI